MVCYTLLSPYLSPRPGLKWTSQLHQQMRSSMKRHAGIIINTVDLKII